jgi:hypothetical protein
MKQKLIRLTLLVFAQTSLILLLTGQTVKVGTVTAELGDTVNVSLEFTGLDNIGAISLFIIHDPNSAEYIDIVDLIPEAEGTLAHSSYNPIIDTIALGISWLAPGVSGVDFPDGKVFDMRMVFKGLNATMNFYEFYCEIVDWDLNVINVTYLNGGINGNTGAEISYWNGTGNWNDQDNWSHGIPGMDTRAVIETGEVNIIGNGICKKLIITQPASLFIQPAGFLTVNDSVNISGHFQIVSTEQGTGSFINNGSITSAGSIVTERYITGDGSYSHLISLPVQSATVDLFGNASVHRFDEITKAWIDVPAATGLEPASGYNLMNPATTTYSIPGNYNYGDVSTDGLSYTIGGASDYPAGLNLVGNPYPSAIAWNTGNWTKEQINAAIYAWNGNQFVTWNGELGDLTNGVIPSFQGFFVGANGTNPELTFPNNARIHSNQPFYVNETEKTQNHLKLNVSGNGFTDNAYIQIKFGSTRNFDTGYDAFKIMGNEQAPQLYSFSDDNVKLSTNVVPDDGNMTAPIGLGFRSPANGVYTLSRHEYSFSGFYELYIRDIEADSLFNLTMDSTYTFSSDEGFFENRFLLYFAKPSGVSESESLHVNVIGINDGILIQLNHFYQRVNVEIFDLAGRQIASTGFREVYECKMELANQKGIFLVKVQAEDRIYITKVLMR